MRCGNGSYKETLADAHDAALPEVLAALIVGLVEGGIFMHDSRHRAVFVIIIPKINNKPNKNDWSYKDKQK